MMKYTTILVYSLAIVIPLSIFVWHTSLFGEWLIDDAGISFAYSRNLAQGHGLVAQSDDPPVEGYSNPAWVGLIALFFLLNIFQPVATTKMLSVVLVGIGYVAIMKSLRGEKYGLLMGEITLCMLSINTSFVIWTTSGLENPLYFACVAVLLYLTTRIFADEPRMRRVSILAGLVAGIAALSRPDGLIFMGLFPLFLVIQYIHQRKPALFAKSLIAYVVPAAATFGGYLVFRLSYFGSLYPNTYVVKGGPSKEGVVSLLTLREESLTKAFDLVSSMFAYESSIAAIVLVIFAVCLAVLYVRKQIPPVVGVAGIAALMALAAYVLLPLDWMPEYRFATNFFPFFYLAFTVSIITLIQSYVSKSTFIYAAATGLLLTYAVVALGSFSDRSAAFAQSPTAPFAYVSEHFGHQFNRYAQWLEVSNGSLLTPDVGGALYYSDLKIYDLAGLTDSTIATTLEKHPTALNNYIFDEAKPTFIHVHGWFSYITYFESDSRFLEDYTPLYSEVDVLIKNAYRVDRLTGDFVRLDAVRGKEDILERIRSEYQVITE